MQALKVIKGVKTEDKAWQKKISEAIAAILVNRALVFMQVQVPVHLFTREDVLSLSGHAAVSIADDNS